MQIIDYIKENPNKNIRLIKTLLGIYFGSSSGLVIYIGKAKNIPQKYHNYKLIHKREDYLFNLEDIYI